MCILSVVCYCSFRNDHSITWDSIYRGPYLYLWLENIQQEVWFVVGVVVLFINKQAITLTYKFIIDWLHANTVVSTQDILYNIYIYVYIFWERRRTLMT